MKERAKILLVGGGGHCKSVIDVIETENKFEIAGIIDTKEKLGMSMSSYEFIGTDDDLPALISKYTYCIIAIGQIKNCEIRNKLFKHIKTLNGILPVIVSPLAYFSKNVKLGEGSILHHNCMVNAGVSIQENAIINSGAIIEHDVHIGKDCHISTRAVINGNARIGNGCFIGSGAVVNEGIRIADNSIIGSGAVVIRDILQEGTFVGNPSKRINNG